MPNEENENRLIIRQHNHKTYDTSMLKFKYSEQFHLNSTQTFEDNMSNKAFH